MISEPAVDTSSGASVWRPGIIVDSWRAFWFRPEPAHPLGLVRMAFGALMVMWALSLRPSLYELFGKNGVVPRQPSRPYTWGLFEIWTDDRALLIGWIVLLVSAIAMMVGWHCRIAAVLVFVLVMSFEWRNPYVFNTGDHLVRLEALFLALAPSGAALSLDQCRRAGSYWTAQCRAPWPLRLMQVQLSLIYVSAVVLKMMGQTWPGGTAVSYSLRLDDYRLVATPDWFTHNPLLINVATWGTLALELSLGVLVWNRRLRPWVLAAGVVMHTAIMISIAVAFFSLAMFVLYLAFIPPETVQRLPDNLRQLARKSLASLRRRESLSSNGPPPNQTEAPSPQVDGETEAKPTDKEAERADAPAHVTTIRSMRTT